MRRNIRDNIERVQGSRERRLQKAIDEQREKKEELRRSQREMALFPKTETARKMMTEQTENNKRLRVVLRDKKRT